MTKKKNGIGQKLFRFALIVPAILSLADNFLSLLKSEAASLRKKVICFLMLALFALVIMMCLWLFLNALLFSYFLHINFGLATSMMLIIGGNFILLIMMFLIMAVMNLDISFPETRKTVGKYMHLN